MTSVMLTIRRAEERGHADHGWLDTHHTFSFADYYDPAHMGFRTLRVLNDDRVASGAGFPTHAHRDMEIVTYVLDGAIAHEDSMGNGSTIRPGDVQRMSAGTGITHSEYNASKSDALRFLQIWIVPSLRGIPPGYEQKTFSADEKRAKLRLVASPDGSDGSVTIHQDVRMFTTLLDAGESVQHEVAPGRHAWVHVARGSAHVNGIALAAGDAVSTSDAGALTLTGEGAEVLIFDLA
jgi:redox-sensitive bicupin YhaK (pirin superfamily)